MRSHSTRWFRLVVLTAAVAALLFLSTGAALWHHDAPGKAASCSICLAAHLPALSNMPAGTPAAPRAVAWLVPAELRLNHATPDTLNSPPRAPPA
jgi:hypothetical protein